MGGAGGGSGGGGGVGSKDGYKVLLDGLPDTCSWRWVNAGNGTIDLLHTPHVGCKCGQFY